MSRDGGGSSGSSPGSSGLSRLFDGTHDAALCACRPTPEETYGHLSEVPDIREQLNHYRNVAENARSELAATLVKLECAQSELRDLRAKMLSKEVACQELKADMESYKENNARKSSLLTSLRDRIQELEEESAALSSAKIRTEIAAHTAIKENQELKEKVVELEEKVQKCLKDNEETRNHASRSCRKQEQFLVQLCDCLHLERKTDTAWDEEILLKLRELCEENAFRKGQAVALEETINVHEMEAKASRETIRRLASEVTREQKTAASCLEEKAQLSQDLFTAVEAKETLEREVKVLEERLLAGQRVWDAQQQELRHLKTSFSELERSHRASLQEAVVSQSQYSSFREKVAALLPGSLSLIGSPEDTILEKIRELGSQEESRKRMVSQLEAQISQLVEQLGDETGLHQKTLQRAQKAETKSKSLQDQLAHLEGELVSGDVLRDNLNLEKQKYLKFLDQLSEKMKLDQMAAELGFDMRLDVALARAEQLVRLESSVVIENKSIAYSLQRKLKIQKERLESRELHMSLLRQKIVQLEEEKQARSVLAMERDEASLTIRKLQKKVERLQKELSTCRDLNTELKAKLADTNELKIKTLEQTKAIEDLNKSRDKLEKMKEKAEKKLMSVKSELDTTEHEAKEDKERARNMLEVVTREMKTLKKSLEEAEKREKQLADFRDVVSQMLGLNVAALALPDYEIVKCLERLIRSHQHHLAPCACLNDGVPERDRLPQDPLKLHH